MSGTLFVVATPIGNLEDFTFRALRTLKEVDLIAAEDTRRTAKLLAHYEVRKPMVSLREHNEAREGARLVARMLAGESVALVSDAGTPGIADPGARLVAKAREAGLKVIPIPGASAVTAAVSVSGHAAAEFAFMGFPPASGTARTEWLERLAREARLVVFFESPHRIGRTLGALALIGELAERQIIINRELTKIHEESVIWQKQDRSMAPADGRGEYAIVVFPRDQADSRPDPGLISAMLACLEGQSIPSDRALLLVARALETTPSQVKKIAKEFRY